jgi:hypothetical protein
MTFHHNKKTIESNKLFTMKKLFFIYSFVQSVHNAVPQGDLFPGKYIALQDNSCMKRTKLITKFTAAYSGKSIDLGTVNIN